MAATKRYYSKVAGARYVFRDGTEAIFAHGFAEVAEQEKQDELDEIIGKNPMIYLPEKLPEPLPKIQQNAVSEAEVSAADAALAGKRVRTAQEVGQVTAEAGKPSDVNQSTVDPALKAAVLNSQDAAAASRAEAARAAAEARQRQYGAAAPSVSGKS